MTPADIAATYDGRDRGALEKAAFDLRHAGLVVLFRGADGRGHFLGAERGVSGYDAMLDGEILLFDRHGYVETGCPAFQHRSRWASEIRSVGEAFETSIPHSAFTLRLGVRSVPAIAFRLAATGRREPIFDDGDAMFMVSKLRSRGYTADQVVAAMRAWDEHEGATR